MSSSSTDRPTYATHREQLELRFRNATLTAREHLTDDYVRVRLSGDDLRGFDTPGHDDHIRIFLPDGPVSTVEEMRAAPSREFTPLAWGETDDGDAFLDLEFALHGDDGVAGVWAANAPLGAPIGVGGPRGTLRVDGSPDGWLLAGDETAIAQIRRYAALIPEDAPALIIVEVRNAGQQVPIDAPVPVEYVHRKDQAPGTALAAALDTLDEDDRPGEDPFVFIAAEQAIVKTGRALACDRWGLDADRRVIKGYWKAGDTEFHAPH